MRIVSVNKNYNILGVSGRNFSSKQESSFCAEPFSQFQHSSRVSPTTGYPIGQYQTTPNPVASSPVIMPSALTTGGGISSMTMVGGLAALGGVAIVGVRLAKGKRAGGVDNALTDCFKVLKEQYKKLIQQFPQDKPYYEQLAKNLGLQAGEEFKLSSIVGSTQLKNLLTTFTPQDFQIGKNFEGIKDCTYRVNLHNHTNASDGKLPVFDFLEQARKWADRVAQKVGNDGKPPFTIAITDHDTMEGARQAVEIIAKNPNAYKNLRLVLGSEISVSHLDPNDVAKPLNFEFIGYALNPFRELNNLLSTTTSSRIKFAKDFLQEINSKYSQLNLNWEEASVFHPNISRGTSNGSAWLIEEYAKFKIFMQIKASEINQDISDSSKKLDPGALVKKYCKDYYYQMDTGIIDRGGITKYFEKLVNLNGYKISNFNSNEFNNDSVLKAIAELRGKYVFSPDVMKEKGIILTPEDVFSTVRKSGEEGFFGFAHPGFIKLKNSNEYATSLTDYCNARNFEWDQHLFWRLINKHTIQDSDLFKAAEFNYQSYGEQYPDFYKYLDYIKKELSGTKLLKTGGIDSHRTIFSKHEKLSMDKIQELNLQEILGDIQ